MGPVNQLREFCEGSQVSQRPLIRTIAEPVITRKFGETIVLFLRGDRLRGVSDVTEPDLNPIGLSSDLTIDNNQRNSSEQGFAFNPHQIIICWGIGVSHQGTLMAYIGSTGTDEVQYNRNCLLFLH